MAGCAGSAIGAIFDKDVWRVFAFGKRIGETNAGHFSFAICPRLSTMSNVAGHGRWDGYLRGRCWMYSGERLSIKLPYDAGKQSRSKTKACRSCPQAAGMIIQLPTHHGLFLK